MNHRQRMENCLAGASLDRAPVALWRHFPVDDQTPDGLAAAVIDFQKRYDFDFVKVTPASSYCLRDWGVEDVWEGNPEGTRRYTTRRIHTPDDWARLPLLDPSQGALAEQLECLRLITAELGPDVPVIQTIFNPLSQAKNLLGADDLLVHMRRWPDALHAGLRIITESTGRFIEAAMGAGIAGVFFATQHAQYGLLSEQEYMTFGRNYDLQVLEPAGDLWLNVLHLHGEQVMFELLSKYPVTVFNWHDRDTRPSLSQGLKNVRGAVCGGLSRERTMLLGTPEQVREEALDAIRSTDGRRFILGTGCVTMTTSPHGNILAARQSVEA